MCIIDGIYKNLDTGEYWNWDSDPKSLKESKKWQNDFFNYSNQKFIKNEKLFDYTCILYDEEFKRVEKRKLLLRKQKLEKLNESSLHK